MNTGLKVIKLRIFIKAYSKSVHITTVHTAIGKIAFKLHAITLSTLIPVLTLSCNKSTHIHNTIFLSTHGHAISQCKHFLSDFLDGLILIAFFTGLNEIGILSKTSRIKHYWLSIFVSYSAYFFKILHRNRLSTCSIICYGNDDKRYFIAIFLECFLKFLGVYIALERNFELCIFRIIYSTVESCSLASFNMSFGSIEVRISRHNISFMHKVWEKHILCSPTLVSRYHILKSCKSGNCLFKLKERCCTGITFVTKHNSCPLTITHWACSWVGEQVDINLLSFDLKHIIVCFFNPLFTFLAGTPTDRLYHLNFPRFCKR